MKTSTMIVYGAVDLTAKADSELTITDAQTFSNINELKKPSLLERKYSTLEKNFFVLDGQSENMGETVTDVAWWSNEMSDENGDFTTPLVMTIDFDQVHSSLGLTLTFSKYAYCNNLKIQYYDSSDTLISEETFTPDNYEYFCEDTVTNYRKIVITFYSTNIPYRYLKLYKIMYGRAVVFEGENLVSANLLEQIDPLSNELSINTLEFTVYSEDDRFNILNPQGVYSTLQKGQPLTAYKIQNGEISDMGTFYIDEWENQTGNKMKFKGVDLIAFLGNNTYYGGAFGIINAGTDTVIPSTIITFQELIEQIMQSAGISSNLYTIQEELKNIEISGYIPICTAREAFQQVLFIVGAVANCSRTDVIEIYQIDDEATPNEISRSNIFKNSEEIKQGQVVTGIRLTKHNYVRQGGRKDIFSGQVHKKDNRIIFENAQEEPIDEIDQISGATLVKYEPNYAIVDIGNYYSRYVELRGMTYKKKTKSVLIPNSELNGDETPNVLKIDSLLLINDANAEEVGERLLNYYNKKHTTKFKFILDDEKVGDHVVIEEAFDNTLDGIITSLDIDMTGGYIANCEVVAKVGEN